MRPRTALLCWEAGSGRGHAVALLKIAQELRSQGWRPVVAFAGDRMPAALSTDGVEVCSAPIWGEGCAELPRVSRSSATMGDVLAQIGLQSSEWVLRQIVRWHELFAEHAADLIIADYAPGAILAARDRLPCVAAGTGYAVPPPHLPSFPALHSASRPLYDEAALCRTVNLALRRVGSRPVRSLPEVLSADRQCVCTIPLFDPYSRLRREPVLGPILSAPVSAPVPGARDIFCYLREAPGSARLDDIVVSLEGLPARVVAYLPGLSEKSGQRLRRSGVDVLERPAPLDRQLSKSRLVVHFGGHGIAAAALLSGVPQVILNFDIEKRLIADGLARFGAAMRFDYFQAEVDEIRRGILSAFRNPSLSRAAQLAAAKHRQFRGDPIPKIVETVKTLAHGS